MLRVRLHFAEGQAFALGHKHRIIAETFAAAGRPYQMAMHFALEGGRLPIRPGQAQDGGEGGERPWPGAVPGAAAGKGSLNALHGSAEIFAGARPACRIDARRAAQRHHFQPGIIGQGGQARRLRGRNGLQLGIGKEARTGLFRLRQRQLGGGRDLEPERGHQLDDLGDLAGIVAGHHEARVGEKAARHARFQMRGSANSRQFPAGSRK